ncbi:MAG TPA: glycosyltransferase family 4 protein [Oligoflexia bacterium]|nr:glycosyltransferase family 4 protein [Oligoflexia bacterium]
MNNRVLVITHFFENHGGGIEIVAAHLCRELVNYGFEVRWAASWEPGINEIPGVVRLPMNGCDFTEGLFGVPFPFWGPRSLLRLRREISQCDALLIHDAAYINHQFAIALARRYGKRIALVQHVGVVPFKNCVFRCLMNALDTLCIRPAFKRVDQVAFVSDTVKNAYANGVFVNSPRVVQNGLDTKLFCFQPQLRAHERSAANLEPQDKVCLFVGRFVEKKGLQHIRRLAARHPEVRWVLIGRGPIQPETWNLPNVTAAGFLPQEQIIRFYHLADTLVLPSVGEGFPLVIQEALACGLPCLVSRENKFALSDAREMLHGAPDLEHGLDLEFSKLLSKLPVSDIERERISNLALNTWSWHKTGQCYADILRGR